MTKGKKKEMEEKTSEAEADAAKTHLEGKKAKISEKEYSELKKKAGERDEYFDSFLRAKADLQNYQKRTKKEIEVLNRLAIQDVMHALLPVLDNLSRAIKSVEDSSTNSMEKFLHGIKLIQGQFLKVLGDLGVKAIHGQEGQAFNPELHEAVMEVESNEYPHHTVLEEVEQGFFLHDKVLRPAKVKVSKKTVTGAREGGAKEEAKGPVKKVGERLERSPESPTEGLQEGVDIDPAMGEEEPIV